jgi:hypothetical protein
MATVSNIGLGDWFVSGEYNQVQVLMSLDEISGLTYAVWSDDERIGIFADRDTAVEFAEKVCDTDYFYPDVEERSDFLSDVDADADALASAGWGTDEDYGCYDDY